MKAIFPIIFLLGLTLSMSVAEDGFLDDGLEDDDDLFDESVDDADANIEFNANENVDEELPSANEPEEGEKEFDIRSWEDDFEDFFEGDFDEADNKKDLIERAWEYKCEYQECNDRCVVLFELPGGKCGLGGKCYCRRKKPVPMVFGQLGKNTKMVALVADKRKIVK